MTENDSVDALIFLMNVSNTGLNHFPLGTLDFQLIFFLYSSYRLQFINILFLPVISKWSLINFFIYLGICLYSCLEPFRFVIWIFEIEFLWFHFNTTLKSPAATSTMHKYLNYTITIIFFLLFKMHLKILD